MGVRSTVAVCLKTEIYASEAFSSHKGWMDKEAERIFCHPEGVMYVFEDVKWYTDDKEISALYKWLEDEDGDGENFLIVGACHDYPESSDGDSGEWQENPWGVYRCVAVSLEYEEAGEELYENS